MNEDAVYLFVCPSLRTVQSFPPKSPRSPPEVIAVYVALFRLLHSWMTEFTILPLLCVSVATAILPCNRTRNVLFLPRRRPLDWAPLSFNSKPDTVSGPPKKTASWEVRPRLLPIDRRENWHFGGPVLLRLDAQLRVQCAWKILFHLLSYSKFKFFFLIRFSYSVHNRWFILFYFGKCFKQG